MKIETIKKGGMLKVFCEYCLKRISIEEYDRHAKYCKKCYNKRKKLRDISMNRNTEKLIEKMENKERKERMLIFLNSELSICEDLDYSIEISKCIDRIKSLEG